MSTEIPRDLTERTISSRRTHRKRKERERNKRNRIPRGMQRRAQKGTMQRIRVISKYDGNIECHNNTRTTMGSHQHIHLTPSVRHERSTNSSKTLWWSTICKRKELAATRLQWEHRYSCSSLCYSSPSRDHISHEEKSDDSVRTLIQPCRRINRSNTGNREPIGSGSNRRKCTSRSHSPNCRNCIGRNSKHDEK